MTQEEKAKAYDEALRKVKDMLSYKEVRREDMEYIFPELKESEDERIRKALISFLKSPFVNENITDEKVTPWIAWLEKQGEQKPVDFSDLRTWKYIVDAVWTEKEGIGQYLDSPFTEEVAKKLQKRFGNIEQKSTDKIEPKFKVGDTITDPTDSTFTFHINAIKDGKYMESDKDWVLIKEADSDYELVEQKPAWSEEDEMMLEGTIDKISDLGTGEMCKDWLKSLKDRVQPQPKQEWKQENIDDLTDFENVMMHIGDSFFGQYAGLDPNDTNAIKEQAAILLGFVPKQEWSEEDEKMLNNIIEDFGDGKTSNMLQEYWLKSLRPQNRWKPSDEQMITLRQVISGCSYDIEPLVEIEEHLKKLREE